MMLCVSGQLLHNMIQQCCKVCVALKCYMCLTEPLGMQGSEIVNVKTECEFIKSFAIFSNQILIAFM